MCYAEKKILKTYIYITRMCVASLRRTFFRRNGFLFHGAHLLISLSVDVGVYENLKATHAPTFLC